MNRPSGVYLAPVPVTATETSTPHPKLSSDDDFNVADPIFTPDGSELLYLGSNERHTHRAAFVLKSIAWNGGETRKVRSVVGTVDAPEVHDFPGLYCDSAPVRGCWKTGDSSGKSLFLNLPWRSRRTFVKVDVTSGTVSDVGAIATALVTAKAGKPFHSVTLLDSNDTGVLVRVESPVLPPVISFVSHAALHGDASAPVSIMPFVDTVTKPAVKALYESLEWELLQVEPTAEKGPAFEAFLVRPKNVDPTNLPGLLVYPHGGPHVCQPTTITLAAPFYCSQNFALLFVNYRGSTGFGEQALHSLPGRAGTADVLDVVDATNAVLDRATPVVDRSKVGVIGGSHGGFLAAHLVGQFPEIYKVSLNLFKCFLMGSTLLSCCLAGSCNDQPSAEHPRNVLIL